MRFLTMTVFLIAASVATAQDSRNLEVTTVVQKQIKETNENGDVEDKLVDATAVAPGEKVFYTITFKNIGDTSADNVVITNPIAETLQYVDGSAFGPGTTIEFSIDGGQTFADGKDLTIVEGDTTRPAIASDFTHVRWVMKNDLAAGAQGIARFAAVLE